MDCAGEDLKSSTSERLTPVAAPHSAPSRWYFLFGYDVKLFHVSLLHTYLHIPQLHAQILLYFSLGKLDR